MSLTEIGFTDSCAEAVPDFVVGDTVRNSSDENGSECKAEVTQQVCRGTCHAAKRNGTVLMATAVIDATVKANPTPSSSIGTMKSVHVEVWTSNCEQMKPAIAISAKPDVSTHRGETLWIRRDTSGTSRNAGPWMTRNNTPILSGETC